MVARMGNQRLAWAELVFDVRAIGAVSTGPFTAKEAIDQKRPGMRVAIHPRALVVWERPPAFRQEGKVLATAGDVPASAMALTGRIPRTLVADRTYDGEPVPVIAESPDAPAIPAGQARSPRRPSSPVEVPPSMRPEPLAGERGTAQPAPPRPATPTTPPKPPKRDDDDEDWIEPPPARR
jgi:hypothetical protein